MTNKYTGPERQPATAFAQPLWLVMPTPALPLAPTRATRNFGRFVRQSGADLFGQVTLSLTPLPNTHAVLFENGVEPEKLPPEFVPAIVEGIWELAQKLGVIGFRITVIDATYHAVDSRPIAFRMAAREALQRVLDSAELTPAPPPTDQTPTLPFTQPLSARVTQSRNQFTSTAQHIVAQMKPILLENGFELVEDGRFTRFQRTYNGIEQAVHIAAWWSTKLDVTCSAKLPQPDGTLRGVWQAVAPNVPAVIDSDVDGAKLAATYTAALQHAMVWFSELASAD